MKPRCLVLLFASLVLLAAVLAGCGGSSGGGPSAWITSGPSPQARLGAYIWVAGAPDVVLRSSDGGARWTVIQRRPDGDIMTGDLWAVAFGDAGHGWAVRRGIRSPVATVAATADVGRTWQWQYPGPKKARLLAVAAVGARHAWAVGDQRLTGYSMQGKGLVLATTDGGATWTRQRLPAGLVPFRVAFSDARHGWLIADGASLVDYHVLATSDGGRHWRVSYSAPSGINLRDVATAGPNRCWAVGYREQPQSGFVARTGDGGRHWSAQSSVSRGMLDAASFPDAEHGWAVGPEGTVIVTSDGGATWSAQNAGGDYGLVQVSFSDPRHGWALIGHLALLATVDGGKSWSVVRPADTRDALTGLTTVDSRAAAGQ
jgi:photosystem II stability/assembly factor-like uncharacterized protein